jgi:hypothetical protein
MDYKKLYKQIPREYRYLVWESLNYPRNSISRWLSGDLSTNRKCKLEQSILNESKAHKGVKYVHYELLENIMVNHTIPISYYDLMMFRIETDLSKCITDPTDIKNILDQAETSIRIQSKDNPYALKLLISKYILHDTRNNS